MRPKRRGITILEILIGFALLSIISMFVYSLFSAQIRLFLTQYIRIDVSSQNKIALADITNQTRQAESIVTQCPNPSPCTQVEPQTSTTAAIYRLWSLDTNGNPTSSYYDYLVYKQVGTNLVRIIYPDTNSTRPASNDIIATNLATTPNPNSGLSFTYSSSPASDSNSITATVTTTKTESSKTQSITQSAKAKIRNKAQDLISVSPQDANGSTWACNGPSSDSTEEQAIVGTDQLLILAAAIEDDGASVQTATFRGSALTPLYTISDGAASVKMQLFYANGLDQDANPNDDIISITFNSTEHAECVAIVLSWTNQTTTFGTIVGALESAGSQSTINAASATGELVVDFFGFNFDTPFEDIGPLDLEPGSGQTEYANDFFDNGITYIDASYKPGSTSTSMQWDWDDSVDVNQWVHVGVPIKPLN